MPPTKATDRLAEIRAASEQGSADWLDPVSDARWLLDEVDRLNGLVERMAKLLSELDRHDRHVVTGGKWTSGMRHRVLAAIEQWVMG